MRGKSTGASLLAFPDTSWSSMARGITTEGSFLLGTFISVFIFGVYACAFVVAVSRMKHSRRKSHVVPIVIGLLFFLTSVSVALQIADIFTAFVDHASNVKGYFSVRSQRPLAGAIDSILFLNLSLGDSFIIWRLYVLWNQNIHVIWLPGALAAAGAVCGWVSMGHELRMMALRDPSYAFPLYTWSVAAISLSLSLTIIVTFLICLRLFQVSRSVAPISDRDGFYNNMIKALIESGSLFSASLLLWAILVGTKQSKAANTSSYLLTVVPGLVPTLIMIRIHSIRNHQVISTDATEVQAHSEQARGGISVLRTTEISTSYQAKQVPTIQLDRFGSEDQVDEKEHHCVRKSNSFADSV
ncbi:hypothetical protein FRC02_002987 [Tulasnella sp. 418]|nr:hypothetical protein FRC02_002987 [Tulasnella sp. 418]